MAVVGVSDMIELSEVTERSIADNLKARLKSEEIYTNIGRVLISVNPFKKIAIYGNDAVQLYSGKEHLKSPPSNENIMVPSRRDRASRCSTARLSGLSTLGESEGKFMNFKGPKPPHLYEVANNMFENMLIEGDNQCVIISGESGAGKTVSAKHVMEFLSKVCGEGSTEVERVKDIIMQSNPLLEAFGNAKTVMNNNSSRFGKFLEIQYNKNGKPDGGKISTFLLEKSRVVSQGQGERNYHIFYQLLSGCTPEEMDELGLELGPMDSHHYLNQTGVYTIDGTDDASEYADTINAMEVVGITGDTRTTVLRLVAAVLHLGNISFTEEDNHALPTRDTLLDAPARLLFVDKDVLLDKLTSYSMETRWGGQIEVTKKTLNKDQAVVARDTLAKAIFFHLFEYLVEAINATMEKYAQEYYLGVLDIYGFESFKKNGFEQFSINYVNEKLQNLFIDFTLKLEQEEYAQEGITWSDIKYFNNDIVLKLIECRRPPGIMSVLDDVCSTLHAKTEGSENTLMDKLRGVIGCDTSFTKYFQAQARHFAITHYAGKVSYEAQGFCEKNKDTLSNDLVCLMQSSSNYFVRNMFPESVYGNTADSGGGGRKAKSNTASAKIRTQAHALLDKIRGCTPHYVRCVKPSESKVALDWDDIKVLNQVRYLGLVENIKVRRAGFAFRREFPRIVDRYAILDPVAVKKHQHNPVESCKAIMLAGKLDMTKYQVGKTKLFLKDPQMINQLEEARKVILTKSVLVIQTIYRGYCARKLYKQLKRERRALLIIQRAYRWLKRRRERRKQKIIHEKISGCNVLKDTAKYHLSMESLILGEGDRLHVVQNRSLNNVIGNVLVDFGLKVKKYSRQYREQDRFLILSTRCLYLVGKQTDNKNDMPYKVKRKLTMKEIKSVSVSPHDDRFVLLHADKYDNLLEANHLVEFVTRLAALYEVETHNKLTVTVTSETSCTIKGGGIRHIRFQETGPCKLGVSPSNTLTISAVTETPQEPEMESEPEPEPEPELEVKVVPEPEKESQPQHTIARGKTCEHFNELFSGTLCGGVEFNFSGLKIKIPADSTKPSSQEMSLQVSSTPKKITIIDSSEVAISDLVAIITTTKQFKQPIEMAIPIKNKPGDYNSSHKYVRWCSETPENASKASWADVMPSAEGPTQGLVSVAFEDEEARLMVKTRGMFCAIVKTSEAMMHDSEEFLCADDYMDSEGENYTDGSDEDRGRRRKKKGILGKLKSTFGKVLRKKKPKHKKHSDGEYSDGSYESGSYTGESGSYSSYDSENDYTDEEAAASPRNGPPTPPPTPSGRVPSPPASTAGMAASAPAAPSGGGPPPPPPPPPLGGRVAPPPPPSSCPAPPSLQTVQSSPPGGDMGTLPPLPPATGGAPPPPPPPPPPPMKKYRE